MVRMSRFEAAHGPAFALALTALVVALNPVFAQNCGNGKLQALTGGETLCQYVRSDHDKPFKAETCDTRSDALFGMFNCGCGENAGVPGDACQASENSCNHLDEGMLPETKIVSVSNTPAEKKARGEQLAAAVASTFNNDMDFVEGVTGRAPPADVCLYSSFALDNSGDVTDELSEMAGCLLTEEDYTTFTFLTYCVDTGDGTDRQSNSGDVKIWSGSAANLTHVGDRLTGGANFQQSGHKCRHGAIIRVRNAVADKMSWLPESYDTATYNGQQVTQWKAQRLTTGVWDFPSMYKLCIHFDDPNWPSILDSSGEFIPMTTRVNYEIQCHDADQNMALDMTDDAECDVPDANGIFGESSARSHHCPKLGGVRRPCDPAIAANLWDLVICDKAVDGTSGCIAATDMQVTRKDLPVRYGGNSTDPKTPKWNGEALGLGTTYVFEHDNTDTSNPFGCSNKQLDNIRLRKHGYMRGDALEAQNEYICADGGRSSECLTDKGEMVHSLDTCYADTVSDSLPGSGKGVVSGIARKVHCTADECFQDAGSGRTDCSGSTVQGTSACNAYTQPLNFCKLATTTDIAKCFVATGTDRVNCVTDSSNAACAASGPYEANKSVKQIEEELLEYDRTCNKELRVRVNKGVTGQLMLRLVVKVYSSQIDETDPWKGYVSQRSTLIPVAIEAVVKDSLIDADMPKLGYAGTRSSEIYEWGLASGGFSAATGSMQIFPTNPFSSMNVHDNGRAMAAAGDVTYHAARYSRSTRTYIEFIDCTESASYAIATERDKTIPRYRITSSASDLVNETFYGDFTYVQDCFDVGSNRSDPNCRMFQMKHPQGSDQTITDLKKVDYTVHFGSYGDRSGDGSLYWSNFSNAVGNFHESYPGQVQDGGQPGLCWQTRLHVYEPSSCSHNNITSDPFYTRVKPRDTLGIGSNVKPTVEIKQPKRIFAEDEMFALDIEVDHPELAKDSEHFYFSHIEICDDFSDGSDSAHNGTGFDLFSYGNTRGDQSSGAYSDAISTGNGDGITKLPGKIGGKTCWRSFANDCTRFIYEQWKTTQTTPAGTPIAGGFMMGSDLVKGSFGTAEECLNDARKEGGHIWGGTGSGNRAGVWFRPPRKDTRNFRMTVTLFTFDGDPAVWNAGGTWQETTDTKTFASIPSFTRYDQHEIKQETGDGLILNENSQKAFPLSTAFPAFDGLDVPLPLREKVNLKSDGTAEKDVGLCTYTSNVAATVDAYAHTNLDDHDRLCDPDATCDLTVSPSPTECFAYTDFGTDIESKTGCKVEAGHRVTCVKTANQKRASRMEIAAIVLFDETEGIESCNNCGNKYLDQTQEWGGGKTQMPDGGNGIAEGYQPAGNNIVASDYQWYRIESAASDPATDTIKRVGWCDTESADLVWTEGGSGSATFHTNQDATIGCNISALGQAASGIASDGLGVSYTATELLNSLQPSDDTNLPLGFMKNFWIVHPKSELVPLPKDALQVQGLSHFNTEQSLQGKAPVSVRVIAVSRDVLQLHEDVVAGGKTATAMSKSNTDQGAQTVTFESVVDKYTPIIEDSAWGRTATIDGKSQWIAYVEEKNVEGEHTDAIRTWKQRANLAGPNEALTLQKDIDCQNTTDFGPEPESSTICLDRLRYNETTDFHDQHSGLVQLQVHYRKTCGPQASNTWHKAGGLFEVSLRVEDDYPYVGSPSPGNGTFKVSDSWRQQLRCNAQGEECGLQKCEGALDDDASNAGLACMIVKQGDRVSRTSPSTDPAIEPLFEEMSPTGAGYPKDMNTTFEDSDHTTGFKSRGYGTSGYSLCVKTLFDNDQSLADQANSENVEDMRGTWCTYASSMNMLQGRNTLTWFNMQTTRPLENHCPKVWDGQQSVNLPDNELECPKTQTGSLARFMERLIAMNARMELPEKWCNCLTFRTSVIVSNDDRESKAAYGRELSFASGGSAGQEWTYATGNPATERVALYTEPQCVAEVPQLYFEPDLQRDRHCVGRSFDWMNNSPNKDHYQASCGNNTADDPFGVKAHNGIKIKNGLTNTGGESTKYISDWGDSTQVEKMELRNQGSVGSFDASVTMVAGYATQMMFSGFSAATDVEIDVHTPYGDVQYNVSEEASYRWDQKGRGEHEASGEVTFLTIESKFEKLEGLEEHARQYFCVYRCPAHKPNCPKDELIRELPLPETDANGNHIGDEKLSNFEKYNVNMDRCPDTWTLTDRKEKCDANGFKKGDNYGRQPNLPFECPSYDAADPNRPGSRYSLKATAPDGESSVAGRNQEWGNVYIVYPKEYSSDDLLEVKLWSRSDWRAEGAGFQYSAMTIYVKMRPSITLSTVSIASKFEKANDDCKHGAKWCCDASDPNQTCDFGAFGKPLQPMLDASYSNSAKNQTTQLSIYESQFNGLSNCKSIVNARVDNATSDSRRQQHLHCGLGIPLRFDDPSLRGVIPTSVRVSIETMAPAGSSAAWTPVRCNSDPSGPNTYPDCLLDADHVLYPEALWNDQPSLLKRVRAMYPAEMAQGIIMPCKKDQQPGDDVTKCAEDFAYISRTSNTVNNRLEAVTRTWINDQTALTPPRFNEDTMTYTHTDAVPDASNSGGLVTWAIGEKMDRKRVWLTGRPLGSGETHTTQSYRFDNQICEPDRVFRVRVSESAGFNEASVGKAYSTMSVTVRDDDRYGRFNLCAKKSVPIGGTSKTIAWPITEDLQLYQGGVRGSTGEQIQINDWKSGAETLQFWVEQARHKSDSVPDITHAFELGDSYYSDSSGQAYTGWDIEKEPILPSRVCVKISVGDSMKPGDWVVRHDFVEGDASEMATSEGTQKTGAEVIANQNLYCVTFPGCKPRDGDTCADAWNSADTSTNGKHRNICSCAGKMPTTGFNATERPTQDLGFKWVRIKISGVKSSTDSACQFDTDQTVSVRLDSVYYPNDNSFGDFKNTQIPVNSASCPQDILPHKDAAIKWVLVANKTASSIQKSNPWKIAFQGLDPNIEKNYDAPISWMGNLKATEPSSPVLADSPLYKNGAAGAFMSFTETEHSKCDFDAAGNLQCGRREINMHMCLQDRKAEADALHAQSHDSEYDWGTTGKTGAQKMSFWVDVQDSTLAYARVGDFYELKCPAAQFDTSTNSNVDPLRTAGMRAPGTDLTDNFCAAYSRKTYQYNVTVGNTTVSRHKPVPCNTLQSVGWRITDVCNDACETPALCSGTADQWQSGITQNADTKEIYQCLSESDRAEYCESEGSKPYRLYFEFSIKEATSGSDLFRCMDPATGDTTNANDDNKYKNMPSFTYTALKDEEVNLSRRPMLIIGSPEGTDYDTGALSMLRSTDKQADASCTPRSDGIDSTGSKVQLRITDDSIFTANNANAERDLSVFEAEFGNLKWNSNDGFMEIETTDRYFDADHEKTLVNVGIGACPSASDLDGLWNTANSANPFAKEAGATGSAFGDCDSLLVSAAMKGLGNKNAAFDALFGAGSAQPKAGFWTDQSASPSGTQTLFNDTALNSATSNPPQDSDKGIASGANMLFTSPRTWTSGAEYTVEPATISNHGNADLSTRGVNTTFRSSLERLQQCKDRNGGAAMTTQVDQATGSTKYTFSMSVTHVQMQRKNDATFRRFSTQCTDRQYTLTVANTIQALSGIRTSGDAALDEASTSYVSSMGYSGETCTTSRCSAQLGPKHACPTASADMRSFEYAVKLDLRSETNQLANGLTVTYHYGVVPFSGASTANNIQVDSGNCYDAAPTGAVVTQNSGSNVLTSTITFRTKCLGLKDANGVVKSNVFASCKDNAAQTTNFDFKVRLYKCTSESDFVTVGSDPSATGDCQDTGNWYHVSTAMAFIEQVTDVQYDAPFEKLMRFYTDIDHRDGTDSTGYLTGSALATWRDNVALRPTQDRPLPTYSADSFAVFSIGFKERSALESTMTTAIKDVSLCEFKLPCYMPNYVPAAFNPSGATPTKFVGADPSHPDHPAKTPLPLCTRDNMLVQMTHSPLALYARNQVIVTEAVSDTQSPGCADPKEEAAANKCIPDTVSNANTNKLPQLSCDKLLWETFLEAEATAYASASTIGYFEDASFGNSFKSASNNFVYNAVRSLNPVLSSQQLYKDGIITDYAIALYGSGEANAIETNANDKFVLTYAADGTTQTLYPTWPSDNETETEAMKATVGVATCKGAQAYYFKNASASGADQWPFRAASGRKVVYCGEKDDAFASPCRLNHCPFMNVPLHSTTGFVLTSVDQFYMDLKKLRRNTPYHFSVTAIMYDAQAYDSLEGFGGSQFRIGSTGRRLLSAAPQLALMERAAIADRVRAADRSMLSVMMPMDDTAQAAAPIIMPNGVAQEQPVDITKPTLNSGTGGFVVTGPPEDQTASNNATDTVVVDITVISNADELDEALDKMPGLDGTARTYVRAEKASSVGEMLDIVWHNFPDRFIDTQHFFLAAMPWSSLELFAGKDTLTIEGLKVGVGLLPATIAANIVLAGFGVTFMQASVNTISSVTAMTMSSSGSKMRPSLRSMAKHLPPHMTLRSGSFFSGNEKVCFSLYHSHFFKPNKDEINALDCICWLDKSHFYDENGEFVGICGAILSFPGALQKSALLRMLFSEFIYILCGFYALAAAMAVPLWVYAGKVRGCGSADKDKFEALYGNESINTWRTICFYIVDFPLYQSWCYGDIDLQKENKAPKLGKAGWDDAKGRIAFWRWWSFIAALRIGLLIVAPLFWLWSLTIAYVYYVLYVVASFGRCCFKGRKDNEKECNDRIEKVLKNQNKQLMEAAVRPASAFSVDNPVEEQQGDFPVSSAHSKSYIKEDTGKQEARPFAI